MAKVLIVYYSRTGNTEKMAGLIKDAMEKEKLAVCLKKVQDAEVKDLLEADVIIMGSPVYYGTMAAELKQLIDQSVSEHGRLDGKIGAAFSSSRNIAGGNETTITDILNAMLVHGMIIQGDPQGSHYGPVSICQPDKRVEEECLRFGKRIAALVKKIKCA